MGQALYRKYRSRSLEELVGQEHITQTLSRAIKAGRVSHAYLLTGPRGVGKTSVARILAHEINGLEYSDSPNLDIIEIDAASNRRIDDIRDLREKVFIAPVSAKYKVYIIDEVHMLTGESFNALLKTLEEPPEHVVFILATTESHKLPATIISRTQRFALRFITREKIIAHLRYIADKESIKISDEALGLIADHGEGTFRDSISLLDQLSHSSATEINIEDVSNTLGLVPLAQLQALTDAVIKADRPGVTKIMNEFTKQGASASTLVAQLSKMLAKEAEEHPQLYDVIDKLLEVPRAYNPDLKLLTVLVLSTNPQPSTPKTELKSAPLAATPPPITIAEAPKPKKPEPKVEEAAIEPEAKAPEPVALPSDPLEAFSASDWYQVLDAVKKASPPLYSVVKQAQPSFNQEKQVLVLAFKYQLHRKKLDDPKYKTQFAGIFADTLGSVPGIDTALDSDATPPPKPPDDPTVAAVAEIMGGGEVI